MRPTSYKFVGLICYNQAKAMAKSKIFLVLSLSFISGVLVGSFWIFGLWMVCFLAVIPIVVIAVFWKNKWAILVAFLFIFFSMGVWRADKELTKLEDFSLDGKTFEDIVIVVKEPEIKENYLKVVLEQEMSKLCFLANAPLYSDISYGTELRASCVLKVPENKDDFDYRMYLAKDGIYYICDKAELEKTGKNNGSKAYSMILKLKNKLEEKISQNVPEPEAALAKGLLVGGSSQLPEKIQENFSKTGMSHIVAVSGYNVTIIAEYLIAFFIFIGFWRKQAFWAAIAGIIIFVAMIGFPSSAVRAGVMGSLLLWAMKNGRLANSYNAIIFAGLIMVAINPLVLRWDIGFQLSFLAAIGIIICSPFWEKIFIKQHKALGFSEIFFLSFSAQIFVLPIILYNFQILSLVSLIANILVLPIIPMTMLLVFLCAVAGFIFQPLSLVLAWLAYLPLRYEIWVINTLAGLSWASMEVQNFGWQYVILWYIILFAVIFAVKRSAGKTAGINNL